MKSNIQYNTNKYIQLQDLEGSLIFSPRFDS